MKGKSKLGTKILSLLLVLSLVISILPIQASAENETQVTPQTYGEWADVVPVNGSFEVGVEGMDVYGWKLSSINSNQTINDTTEGDLTHHYTLKTIVEENGNKAAALHKFESGYAGMKSQAFSVVGGGKYRISYKFKTIQAEENPAFEDKGYADLTKDDMWGISVIIRQIDAEGNVQDTYAEKGQHGKEVSTEWESISYDFIASDDTTSVELYFFTGGRIDLLTTILFDDVSVREYKQYEVYNGDFEGITYVGEDGRKNNVEGPEGWSAVSCDDSYNTLANDNRKTRYAATIEEAEGRGKVLKYTTSADKKGQGVAMLESQLIPIPDGTTYTVNYDLKTVSDGETTQSKSSGTVEVNYTNIRVSYYQADGVTQIGQDTGNKMLIDNNDWANYQFENTVPTGTTYIKIGFSVAGGWYQENDYPTIYVDNVSLDVPISKKETVEGEYGESLGNWNITNYQYEDGYPGVYNSTYSTNYKISNVVDAGTDGKTDAIQFFRKQSWGQADLESPAYAVTPGENYQVSFDYKMTDYKADIPKANGTVFALRPFVRVYDKDGNFLSSTFLGEDKLDSVVTTDADKNVDKDITSNYANWTTVTEKYFTVPENAAYCRLYFGAAAYDIYCSFSYWFCNIEVKPSIDDATDLLFVMLEGGNATGDEEGVVDVCDLVRMKRKEKDTTIEIHASADMNKNSKNDTDDMKLLRWKLIGICRMDEL